VYAVVCDDCDWAGEAGAAARLACLITTHLAEEPAHAVTARVSAPDCVMVERLMAGDALSARPRPNEVREAVRRLAGLGLNDREIAARIGRSEATVSRTRARLGAPARLRGVAL